jgi:hypothetical protein
MAGLPFPQNFCIFSRSLSSESTTNDRTAWMNWPWLKTKTSDSAGKLSSRWSAALAQPSIVAKLSAPAPSQYSGSAAAQYRSRYGMRSELRVPFQRLGWR